MNNTTNASEETALLQSLDASIQNQDVYEDRVLRDATHQLAPPLMGIGMPELHALGPSYVASRPDQPHPADVPHVHAILSRVRKQQETAILPPNADANSSKANSNAANLLFMKEQILLHFLQTTSRVAPDDLPVHYNSNAMEEKRRRNARRSAVATPNAESSVILQSSSLPPTTAATATNNDTTNDANGSPNSSRKRQRVSIMKRKEITANDDDDDDEDFKERREHLRRLRKERQERKKQRQQQMVGGGDGEDNDEEEEAVFDDDNDHDDDDDDDDDEVQIVSPPPPPGAGVKVERQTNDEVEVTSNNCQDKPNNNMPDDQTGAIIRCPLCNSVLDNNACDGDTNADEVLSRHISECQQQRRSTRSSRAASTRSRSTNSKEVVFEIDENDRMVQRPTRKRPAPKKPVQRLAKPIVRSAASIDDIDEQFYEDRVEDWIECGISNMKVMKERDASESLPGAEDYDGGLHVPEWVNDRLFPYQRKCLKWMWKLHQERAGGIVGDEMGLGKTVQVSSFLGALICSRRAKSILVVSPATMLQHWLSELAKWAPGIRRVLVHASGELDGTSRSVSRPLLKGLSRWLKSSRRDRLFEPIDDEDIETMPPHSFCGTGYAIVTTYENIRRNADLYAEHNWSYVVLDEAQKIRNPDADVTLACKRLRTPHRLAMTGTPIQNDLRELWSLFDFVFPGRLGTLPAFEQEFAEAIKRGGYSNASPMQVQLAYRCALVLRDLISPYMLRRQKKEVKEVARMPGKSEHVLFCRLSHRQRSLYEAYLQSDEVTKVRRGSTQLLAAITMLRKICNHPDLACDPEETSFNSFFQAPDPSPDSDDDDDYDVGTTVKDDDCESLVERSGKLEVLSKILPLWKKQGHRVLVFCQWQKMLNIIEKFMMLQGWKFGRLDGKTNVASRQRLVDQFNSDESFFAVICTTRTGGVGLNLTGANRIILYDPDWNPQTDAQARERAWRFGQEREVTVYRLITAGTVEEKIYQRQIFKTALSNKVLQDPRQRRLFSQRDLNDLFTLKADVGSVKSGGDGMTETTEVAQGAPVLEPDSQSKDNQDTIRTVLRSKGLAGVLDHNFAESDPSKKSRTVREMESEAKRVAREAVKNLQESVMSGPNGRTSSGSKQVRQVRFGDGGVQRNQRPAGSSSLLSGLRQRNASVAKSHKSTDHRDDSKYTALLGKIKDYVYRFRPTTNEILNEFEGLIPDDDVAIFRSLLKSVASVENGRWRLKQQNGKARH